MRQLFIVLILFAAMPAAAAQVEPYVEYNPSTGDMAVKNVRGYERLRLAAIDEPYFNLSLATRPVVVEPVGAIAPLYAGSYHHLSGALTGMAWAMSPDLPSRVMEFDAIILRQAVPPRTPTDQIRFSYGFLTGGGTAGSIVLIPEPSAVSLACLGLISLAVCRRRQ